MFTCHTCGLQHVRVEVPVRRNDQDAVSWVKKAMEVCAARHKQLAPACNTGHLDLLVPMNKKKDSPVGAKVNDLPMDFRPDAMKSRAAN